MTLPIPNSLETLQIDFSANALANARALLRISRALNYEQVDTPDGMIAAILNLAADALELKR